VNGAWVPGPGRALFDALEARLGRLPIIVEDLGIITDDVRALRDELGYPGMAVLQFAFGGDPHNPYLPRHHRPNQVVYTGTHDNDTTLGWWEHLPDWERDNVRRELGVDGSAIVDDMIRAAMHSIAETAIIPMQDLLALGSEHRMNHPGRAEGNWTWRFAWDQVHRGRLEWFAALASESGRSAAGD
ncbi:MAG: 4-alpha-glucanotransferase, partial [Tepidiforma sp.]